MKIETYNIYRDQDKGFDSKYSQFVNPDIFDLDDKPSQVRDTDVLNANVPSMMESMRNRADDLGWRKYGQLSPCTVSEDTRGNLILRDGFTRTKAMQRRLKEGENVELLVNSGKFKIDSPSEDEWYDFGCDQNDHLPSSPNTSCDVKVQIANRVNNGYFDRKAGCCREQNPELWMETALELMTSIYSNSSIKGATIEKWIATKVAKKEAASQVRGKIKTYLRPEDVDFVVNHCNQLPFKWDGSKAGDNRNNNVVYFATRRGKLRKDIVSFAFDKTNSQSSPNIYLFVHLEDVVIVNKSVEAIQAERQWFRDEVKRINSHPSLRKPLINGVWFLPQVRKVDPSMYKFIK